MKLRPAALLVLVACFAGFAATAQPLPGEAERERRIANLKEITAAHPKDVGSWHDLADLYREAGRWDEAVAADTKAIEGHPKYAVAYYGRGHARMEKRDYAAARADFTFAIGLWEARGGLERFTTVEIAKPEHVAAYRDRGVSFAHEGKPAEGVADLSTALKLRPDDPRLLFERGHLLEKAGRKDEAVADFSRAGLIHAEGGGATAARECAERLRKLGAPGAADAIEKKLKPAPKGSDLP